MLTNFQLADHAKRLNLPLIAITNKDKLPPYRRQGHYIFNLMDDEDHTGKNLPGSHWVCAIISNNQAVYMDPFGFPPAAQVQHFLKPYKPYAWSEKQIQNPTSHVCGYFVLYFLYWMNKHKKIKNLATRMETFLDLFSDDYTKNKTILERLIKPL